MKQHRTPATTITLLALAASTAWAQPKPTTGLDSLDETRVQAELATRGLGSLLDYSFNQAKTPESQRNSIRTLVALRQLTNPHVKLTAAEKDKVIAQVIKGIQDALPTIKDPKLLLQQAGVLVETGIKPDLDMLEYWGENPRRQAAIRPLAEAVQKIYARAIVQAQAAADKVAEQMANGSNAYIDAKWTELDNMATTAKFNKAMAAYPLARSIDKADPMRKQVADDAIAVLQPFDADGTNVQAVTRVGIGKLNLAKGDFATAKTQFDSIETEGDTMTPKPRLVDRYNAKYLSAESLLLAGDAEGATKGLEALRTWQKANVPAAGQAAVDVTARLLEYRIASLQADKATGAKKTAANDKAIATLVALLKEYPQYQATIYEQLLDRIPVDADVKKLDTLLLAALMQKGSAELGKTGDEKPDAKALETAIDATREIIARKDRPGTDAAMVEDASIRLPYFLMKLDRKPETAAAFLAYVKGYPKGEYDKNAIDNAGAILFEMQRTDQANPKLAGLMDAFLPLAIDRFHHTELAYMYGVRLREMDQYAKAVKYLAMVPKTDPNIVKANYFEMLALKQQLDADEGKLSADDRAAMIANIQKLAKSVDATAPAALAKATSPADKNFYRYAPARTALLAADLTKREGKDPAKTIQLLENFETTVKGAPGEEALLSEALFLRVGAYMDLGQSDKATQNLVALLNTKGGEQGLRIVFDLLQRLDQDYNNAVAHKDLDRQRLLAKNRAELSGYLVAWAADNKDEKIRKFTYKYRVFDASSKQLAANLTVDPAAKKAGLTAALKLYESLQSPENVALYKATLPPGRTADANYPDPQVTLGLALTQYDLGNYTAAVPLLSRLLNDGKLGAARITVTQNGEARRIDNDQFWEATYKQLRGYTLLAAAPDADAAAKAAAESAKGQLKRLYIQYGKGVGGKTWGDAFEQLRKEIAPDFKVQELAPADESAPGQSPPTTTQAADNAGA